MKAQKTIVTIKPVMLDIENVVNLTGLSESSIRALINRGEFPKARKASDRGARWLTREIEEWAESRPVADFLPPPNTDEGGRNGKPFGKS